MCSSRFPPVHLDPKVNDAEAEGEGHTLCIKPVAEVQVAPDCFITTLVRGNGEWTAMDKHGRIYRVHLPKTSMLDTSGYKVGRCRICS